MCIEWNDDDPMEFVGQFSDDDYTRFEVIFVPCNYLHIEGGYDGDSIHPECIEDLDKQIEYVGASNWIVYVNQERINFEKYGEGELERFSEVKNF